MKMLAIDVLRNLNCCTTCSTARILRTII